MIKRDTKLITLALLLIVLGLLAALLASELDFLPPQSDNPALLIE